MVKDYDLFVRKEDDFSVSYDTVVSLKLPQFGDSAMVTAAKAAGETVGNVGKTQLVIIFLLTLLGSHQLNKLLGQVRNLGLVTHLMLMKLVFPPITVIFFSGLFEYVTFDIIPTEEIYAYLFGWQNVAYSEEAESIGYSSRYFIENAGSIPIYIAVDIVLQLLFAFVKLVCKSGRIRGYAARSQARFFWAGCNGKFNDAYLTIAFTVGINMSSMAFVSTSVAFNNCVALFLAALLVLSPLKTGFTLIRGWKKNSSVADTETDAEPNDKAAGDQNEGGEKENNDEQSSSSQISQTLVTDMTNVTILQTQSQHQDPQPDSNLDKPQ